MPGFIETPRFPDDIAVWAKGGPRYSTTVIELFSGLESRNINWPLSRGRWDLASVLAKQDISGSYAGFPAYAANTIIAWFRAMKGMGYGFRFKDFHDFKVTQDGTVAGSQGLLGTTGLGIVQNPNTYQSYRQYLTGSNSDLRKILKPVTGTCAAYRNGAVIAGATLDTTTGIWTIPYQYSKLISNPGITQANPGNVHVVAHGLSNGNQVYIDTVVGMTQVNGGPYTVTTAGVDNFTIGINTTGFGAYVSGGRVYMVDALTDVMTWDGQFDVPVRFDVDALVAGLVSDGSLYEISSLPLLELLNLS